jgi:uncharacterized protein (DUF4415 family)
MTDLEKFIAKCEENAVPDSEINLSDMPELTKEDFERGHFKYWKPVKKSITVRIDLDNLSWLQSAGVKGYQTKMNDVIRWARFHDCPIISAET